MKLKELNPTYKITFYKTFFIGIITILIARLFYLQITLGETFAYQSKRNFTRIEETLSLRGNILDCNGSVLATNRPVTDLYWQGSGNKIFTLDQRDTLEKISVILEKNLFLQDKELQNSERYSKKICLAKDLSFVHLSKIIELFSDNPNIRFTTHFKRFYPYKTLAPHSIGYLSYLHNSCEGKTGIEKIFEDTLRGKPGSIMHIINSLGVHLSEVEIEKNFQGQNIVTTLDLDLQIIAEDVFSQDLSGALIIMDPETGALRACVSRPTFDPNLFTSTLDNETWKALQEKKPFLNRISNAAYPIGSIFKIITLSAALETNIIEQHSSWECCGYTVFAGRNYGCVKKEGHGFVTTKFSLAHSCNIPFFEMAKKMDIDTISHYAELFGLGKKTDSILPEALGLIPSRAWKRKVKHERWWRGETLSASIGQTYLLATPLQIARMIAAIETGFLVTPRIIESLPITQKPLAIKTETRLFLQKAMHAAVTHGTARWLNQLPQDFVVHAKTSTAQTASLEKSNTGKKEFLEHSWLASNFRYKHHPPLTLVIITEHTGRTGIPPRIAYNFLKRYKNKIDSKTLPHKTTAHTIDPEYTLPLMMLETTIDQPIEQDITEED